MDSHGKAATAAISVLLDQNCFVLIAQFQDGIFEDLHERFTERFQTAFSIQHVLDGDGVPCLTRHYLPPSFRSVRGESTSKGRRFLEGLALYTHSRDRRFPLHLAILEGDMNIVRRILACQPGLLSLDALCCAVYHQSLEFVQELLPMLQAKLSPKAMSIYAGLHLELHASFVDIAAERDNFALLVYLHDHGMGEVSVKAMEHAAKHGNLDMVRFLKSLNCACNYDALLNAVSTAQSADVVNFLLQHYSDEMENHYQQAVEEALFEDSIFDAGLHDVVREAAQRGRIDMLTMLMNHFPNIALASVFVGAARAGHIHVLEWLWDVHGEPGSLDCWKNVLQNQQFQTAKWIISRKLLTATEVEARPAMFDFSAPVSSIEMVDLLHSVNHPLDKLCPTTVEVAKYLQKHGIVFSSLHLEIVIDCAKADDYSDHFEVVKYLHKNCPSIIFKTQAMDIAARNGLLDIVDFLHKNGTEGCTPAAMEYAVRCEHLQVVKYLSKHCSECASIDLLHEIAHAHVDVLSMDPYARESLSPSAFDVLRALGIWHGQIFTILPVVRRQTKGAIQESSMLLTDAVHFGQTDHLKLIDELYGLSPIEIEQAIEQVIEFGALHLFNTLWEMLECRDGFRRDFLIRIKLLLQKTAQQFWYSGPWRPYRRKISARLRQLISHQPMS
ncbi:unnamed protein product [Aphanomyces euteiches]|uniref:Uncharacterized protein n=1 Tax=Aphanomyces euteiches TaxID=100861 RepID=A0A6G0X388_9STRA|nr:hypothetical protein Ae201684_008956 [Aphanomyces euteiches]KAH9054465.1 hypothetical protein Ae201684P_018184 [Aphanomyces euteiches]KAH9154969.1 hypothetical protein AeRB84_003008 [Aphanomyces euteiches]